MGTTLCTAMLPRPNRSTPTHSNVRSRRPCSKSLHFVGLAISASLFTSSPHPSCTTDSSAAPRATAPVQSLVHAWPCYAPLQPLLLCLSQPLPSLSFSVHISHSITRLPALSPTPPPRFPYAYAFLIALCPYWHTCCLDKRFECLPLDGLPFLRFRWKGLILHFPKSLKALQSVFLVACHSGIIQKLIKSTFGQQSQLSTQVPVTGCIRLISGHFG
jgi:hypothetical protein